MRFVLYLPFGRRGVLAAFAVDLIVWAWAGIYIVERHTLTGDGHISFIPCTVNS
jgi:hypothetical protein